MDEWIARDAGRKPTTTDDYKAIYRIYVKDGIGRLKVRDVTPKIIYRYFRELSDARHLSRGTVDFIFTILHCAMQQAVDENTLSENPFRNKKIIKGIGTVKEKRHALTRSQQARLIEFVSTDDTCRRFRDIIIFLLGTGMRRGEAFGLQWENCDFTQNVIKVRNNCVRLNDGTKLYGSPKTGAGIRDIPMLGEIRDLLLSRKTGKMKGKDFVFTEAESKIAGAWERIIARENKDALDRGLDVMLPPHVSCHTLRHTFCTRLCEAGTNIKVVQDVMGHASANMTMDIYNEVMQDQKNADFKALDGKLFLH